VKTNVAHSKFVKHKQAAEHLGVSYHVFRHAVAKGLIPFYKLGTAKLFKLEEVETALQAHRVATTQEVLA
jgi:excisionase family DNA binding protein